MKKNETKKGTKGGVELTSAEKKEIRFEMMVAYDMLKLTPPTCFTQVKRLNRRINSYKKMLGHVK